MMTPEPDPGDACRPIVVVSVQDDDRPVECRPSTDHCVTRPPRLDPSGAESVLVPHHQVQILTVLRRQVTLNVAIQIGPANDDHTGYTNCSGLANRVVQDGRSLWPNSGQLLSSSEAGTQTASQ